MVRREQGSVHDHLRVLFAAYAELARGLVPEVASVSIHDAKGAPLWLSADFLAPEEHERIAAILRGPVEAAACHYDLLGGGRMRAAFRVTTSDGRTVGALLLGIDLQSGEYAGGAPLERRMAALLTCLAVALDGLPEHRHRIDRGVLDDSPDEVVPAEIRAALREDRFVLFLQPIHSLHEDAVAPRHEVLLRMRSRSGALLPPRTFLPMAERLGLAPAIDRWVVRTLLVWLRGLKEPPHRTGVFAVNLSSQSLEDPHFLDYVERCLDKSGVAARALCFEVNATAAAARTERFAALARHLTRRGCRMAIDDFDAPMHARGGLRKLPAHCVKIDGTLLASARADERAHSTVAGIVGLANDLGILTVAEAVESDEDLSFIRSLGIDCAQGFLFGPPRRLESYAA